MYCDVINIMPVSLIVMSSILGQLVTWKGDISKFHCDVIHIRLARKGDISNMGLVRGSISVHVVLVSANQN